MKFGPVPVRDAAGAILAHSLGVSGRRLKKGRVLNASDLAALGEARFDTVTVAQPEAGDVLEDIAAGRIVSAMVPDAEALNIRIGAPFTGRANLYAECAGVLEVDARRVRALNAIDEAITFASLPAFARVAPRQMLGTVKIIPYGCAEDGVLASEALLSDAPILKVHPVVRKSAHLILTRTPGMKESVVAKGADAVLSRLAVLGITDVTQETIPHEPQALADAIRAEAKDMVLILTGSATSDRGDVGPAGLVASGGTLSRFGMPVDPGNLLFLGDREGTPVIGLPGCVRSPKLNGADWVIERVACGLDVTPDDIADMGVGGLLKEISSRPQPREGGAAAPQRPVIAAILLAAGSSSRMRGRDKLIEPVDGAPLLQRVATQLVQSGVDEIVCVSRPEDAARREALASLALTHVENPLAAEGMATSISKGIATLSTRVDAAIVVMGDMPEIASADIDRLIAAFDPEEDRSIIRAVTPEGVPGHPVLFGRRFFEVLRNLEGDRGARAIVAEHPEFVVDVALAGQSAVTDLDTPEAWSEWQTARSQNRRAS